MASARGRPWAEITVASSQGRPIRAKASDTDEGAGRITRFLRSITRKRARTMPKNPGSPEASTHTVVPWPDAAATPRHGLVGVTADDRRLHRGPPRPRCHASKASRCRRPPRTSPAPSRPARTSVRMRSGHEPAMPTTVTVPEPSGTGDHLVALEVDHDDLAVERPPAMGNAVVPGQLAQPVQRTRFRLQGRHRRSAWPLPSRSRRRPLLRGNRTRRPGRPAGRCRPSTGGSGSSSPRRPAWRSCPPWPPRPRGHAVRPHAAGGRSR